MWDCHRWGLGTTKARGAVQHPAAQRMAPPQETAPSVRKLLRSLEGEEQGLGGWEGRCVAKRLQLEPSRGCWEAGERGDPGGDTTTSYLRR